MIFEVTGGITFESVSTVATSSTDTLSSLSLVKTRTWLHVLFVLDCHFTGPGMDNNMHNSAASISGNYIS